MPSAGRLGDKAQIQQDSHGCPGCPHPGVGPAIAGSTNVLINGRPALRVDDVGIHAVCCGPNMWSASEGSPTVFINGKAAFRRDDPTKHCGGQGKLVEGSDDVVIGGASSGGSSSQANSSAGGNGGSGAGADAGGAGPAGQDKAASSGATAGTGPDSASSKAGDEAQAGAQAQVGASDPSADSDTARWSIQDADGNSMRGVRATFSRSVGDKDVNGGRGQVPGLTAGEDYTLTVVGTTKVQGRLEDADGHPVAEAQIRLDRAWGPSGLVTTDGGGRFEADGFAQDEPFEATVMSSKAKAQGRLVDDDGKPLAGVCARVRSDGGFEAEVITDADGKWELEGLLPGEGYQVVLVGTPRDRT